MAKDYGTVEMALAKRAIASATENINHSSMWATNCNRSGLKGGGAPVNHSNLIKRLEDTDVDLEEALQAVRGAKAKVKAIWE